MRVTLQQIADKAGVSRGTVDRALNNRGRINPEVAERIKTLAAEMGYEPNRVGRALAISRQNLSIGVIVQSASTPFMKEVLKGIRQARKEAEQFGISVDVRLIPDVDADSVYLHMSDLLQKGCNGLALLPSHDERIFDMIRAYHEKDIPVITFNSDLASSDRICYIGQDAAQSGRTAAGLMSYSICEKGKVAVISGSPANESHMDRVTGFVTELSALRSDIILLPTQYAHDSISRTNQIMETLLEENPDVSGIYLAAAGAETVCDHLQAYKFPDEICVISHDLTEKNRSFLKNGYIRFLLGQDAYRQGYEPIMKLFHKLFDGQPIEAGRHYTGIEIKTRYN